MAVIRGSSRVPRPARSSRGRPTAGSLAYTVWETRDPLSRRIYVVPVDGGAPHPLLPPGTTDASQFDPAWSPDGESIAFTLASPGGSEVGDRIGRGRVRGGRQSYR